MVRRLCSLNTKWGFQLRMLATASEELGVLEVVELLRLVI